MSEHIHEVPEEIARQQIAAEADYAQDVIEEAAASGRVAEDPQAAAKEAERLRLNRLFVMGLREIAEFYETHPEVKLPGDAPNDWRPMIVHIFGATKPEIVVGARAMGKCKKFFEDDTFRIQKEFPSGTILEFYSSREQVCEKIPDGQELVPERVIPAKPEEVVPATVRPKYRWRCHALLAPEETEAAEVGVDSAPPEPIRSNDDYPF